MHSMGTVLAFFTSMERPVRYSPYFWYSSGYSLTSIVIRWLGIRSLNLLNQKAEMRERISPLYGISSGRM